MILKKKATIAALTLSLALTAGAKPAKPMTRAILQKDGTTLTVHKVGNEKCHYTLTDDNKLLIADSEGQYCYANIATDGTLSSTGVVAHNVAIRPAAEAAIAVDITSISINEKTNARKRSNAQTGVGKFSSDFPTEGNIKGIMILAQFSDVKFKNDSKYKTSAKDYFTNMMQEEGFSESNGTGSAKDYFNKVSTNKFHLECDVAGPYTVSNGYAYYGQNNDWDYDKQAYKLISEVCKLADADVDFSKYDNDGDGKCDFVYVIYAGEGESSYGDENTIWPHSDYLSYYRGQSPTLDGVQIDKYACSNEWESTMPDGVGTFVHEFSHVMGLPDLYYTGYEDWLSCTPGDYDILDVGCYNNDTRTPPTYSAYERNAMGWIDLKELSEAEDVTLENLEDTNTACIIKTERDDEFFLLENRQQSGWDAYIPGHGVLIWHIDGEQKVYDDNTVNNTKDHQYVDIVEANNRANNSSSSAMKGWPWPGTANKTSFTSETNPALKDWEGNAIEVPITEIAENDGKITFKVKGGGAGVHDIMLINAAETTQTEYYNLQGIRVSKPAHGLYIARTGNTTAKVMVQ